MCRVVVHGIVMEQRESRARFLRDVHRVLDRAVSPVPLRPVLSCVCCASWISKSTPSHSSSISLRDVVVGIVGVAPGTVVGDVRDRHAVPVDAVAEGRPDVAHPARPHLGEADREIVVAGVVEPHVACELRRSDREVRRAHDLREHVAQRALGLARPVDVERRTLAVERREERQALHVIPMKVRQQHRPVELVGAVQPVRAQAGSEVEDDRRWPSDSSATHDECPP